MSSAAKEPLDEDEEFKLAESLAESFALTQQSLGGLSKRELEVALQRSHKQLNLEKSLDNKSMGVAPRSVNDTESLNYSVT